MERGGPLYRMSKDVHPYRAFDGVVAPFRTIGPVPVTVQDIVKVLLANAEKAKGLVARLARDLPRKHEPCPIGSDRALDTALITAPEARDPELIKKLDAVAGRVLGR